jgi:hypothetical protein
MRFEFFQMGRATFTPIIRRVAEAVFFLFVRESRGIHRVFADLTICEKYRWMPR